MEKIHRVYLYIFGPNVNRVHKSTDGHNRSYYYEPNDVEDATQKILSLAYVAKLVLIYTLPFWAFYIYRQEYYTEYHLKEATRYTGWIISTIAAALLFRALARARNQEYVTFLDILQRSINDPGNGEKKKRLRRYDFDFKFFPLDYRWDEMEEKKPREKVSNWKRIRSQHSNAFTTVLLGFPKEVIAFLISHTFGIRLLYPGCVKLLHAAMNRMMWECRSSLVEKHGGRRCKLFTEDKNTIDTMFIDRRHKTDKHRFENEDAPDIIPRHGETLVICCEGNAGFYEGGCMTTPLECGFSVLGWNHPGFMHSSGKPFPEAEDKAMDMVMQYALHKLSFPPKKILIYGWSIGAYTAINAAIAYPDIHGIILDATFHDLVPIARRVLPFFLGCFVHYTVRNYLNLHNCENLRSYKGPVLFIRRERDEVMNIAGPLVVSSNLANHLLEDFLKHRFPNLFEDPAVVDEKPGILTKSPQSKVLWDWFCAPDDRDREKIMNNWDACPVRMKDAFFKARMKGHENFNIMLGKDLTSIEKTQVVLYLASKYMRHFNSSHCPPISPSLFLYPWRVESLFERADMSDSSDYEVLDDPTTDEALPV